LWLERSGMGRARSFPYASRVLLVIATVLLTAGWGVASLRPGPAAAADGVDYVFNVNCPISHFNSDDPIVFPEQPGVSHRHAFYGNVSTNANTTTKSLTASKSTCERGFSVADRSAYWVPTLYRKLSNGTLQEIRLSGGNQHLAAYYRRSGGSDGEKVKPFPKGLRMVAGNPFARSPQNTIQISWRCNGGGGDFTAGIPNCASGTVLQAFVGFPDCWDGKHLDTADHRSHMTFSRGERGSCPASHPVKVPNVTFEISFNMSPVAGSTFELSSGGQYSLHGDFFNAWDDRVQSALVNSCLNAGRYCENIKLSEVDLRAAGPVPKAPEPTRSAAPKATPSAGVPSAHPGHAVEGTPSAATVIGVSAAQQDTGGSPVVLGAVLAAFGAMVLGSALFYWRRRTPQRAAGREVARRRV